MKPQNSDKNVRNFSYKCTVCDQLCQYFYYGVKCCEACKHFFRRSISMMKEYNCKNCGQCEVKKGSKCKQCRLKKCFSVGMNPRGVCATNNFSNGKQILAFVKRFQQKTEETDAKFKQCTQQQAVEDGGEGITVGGRELFERPANANGHTNWVEPNSVHLMPKSSMDPIFVKYFLEVEQKVRRICDSQTPIPQSFYNQCDSFEAILDRKLNLLDVATKFSPLMPSPPTEIFYEKIRQFGPFCKMPPYLAMDLLFVFEIGKTFPFFEQLNINDKIALCSNIAMPLLMLSNGFYSAQQNCDALSCPMGIMPIKLFKNSFYKDDLVAMEMANSVLYKAMVPFIRLQLSTEEFVILRAIIYAHMVTPGLSDEAQKILYAEAEKYSSLLMSFLQTNYGAELGVRRFIKLMGLIEFVFNSGAKHRQMLTYISNVLDPNFDKVMPFVLAKVSTNGPVELHQMLPFPHNL